ncbi:MAG: hypothetical protein ACTHK4_02005 [Mycobacteriales bacterium]
MEDTVEAAEPAEPEARDTEATGVAAVAVDEATGVTAVSVDEPTGVIAVSVDEATGVTAVDAALERLRDLEGAPVEAHVEVFDDVQRQLHEALAELDE